MYNFKIDDIIPAIFKYNLEIVETYNHDQKIPMFISNIMIFDFLKG